MKRSIEALLRVVAEMRQIENHQATANHKESSTGSDELSLSQLEQISAARKDISASTPHALEKNKKADS